MASLYSGASKIVDKVIKKKGTIKSLVIESDFENKKILYALVCETLKYKKIIDEILEQTDLLKLEKQLKLSFALVLVYEFLFGHGLKCGGKFKQCISRNKSSLNSALARIKIREKVSSNADLLSTKTKVAGSIPRYVRVNLLLTSIRDVVQHFKNEGYNMLEIPQDLLKKERKSFHMDEDIPDVIVFPPATDLHNHPLYLKGHIILQDKASCLPAHVLDPPPGSHVIDACAAPGNKTSHLASRMNNKGKIHAFDTDSHRLSTMKKLMTTAGVSCVTMRNMSFLKVDPSAEEYNDVEYIVLDPSCSGSGIVNRMDHLTDDEKGDDFQRRLDSLSQFQLTALLHALSFPSVKKVVYSTCSVHRQENEDVVKQALSKSQGEFELSPIMAAWTNRGLPVFPGAERCIRASPEVNQTNGFFVALFTRKEVDSEHTNGSVTNLDQVNVHTESCHNEEKISPLKRKMMKNSSKKNKKQKLDMALEDGDKLDKNKLKQDEVCDVTLNKKCNVK
ncbi:probable 28S rRNA (cytosine-C(5))-methyltransferase, partial [Actinia tenebrosa]|uniref:Probable 28S rRNA (Cytosine-C(5))-methyltransferase n=1 Tax=Actinia tenebrosa TaxID=6105 RepID=A0A6P8IEE2_ACTTE